MQRLSLTRRDGAPLTGYLRGRDGPLFVLANGLGGPVAAFRHQLAHFGERFRVLTWDYRGLYGSSGASPPERVDLHAHADDLEDLLGAVDARDAILLGWSMGVQVVLELAARRPDLVRSLILVSGTSGEPLSVLRFPGSGLVMPGLVDRARAHHELAERLVARLSSSRWAAEWARRLHLVSPALQTDELLDLAREFRSLDLDVYLRTLAELGRHDASRLLSSIRARTLVVAGGRDPLFSPRLAQDLARRLPHAELYVVPAATHYAPVEFPALVNARIDSFLSDSEH